MKLYSTLICLFLFLNLSFSQTDTITDHFRLFGNLMDFETGDELAQFELRVILNAEVVYVKTYENSLEYELHLPYGFDYDIQYFSKGYVSRAVMIDASDIPLSVDKIFELNCDIGLPKKKKGIRMKDISKMPSGVARYSPTQNKLTWFVGQKEKIDELITNRIGS